MILNENFSDFIRLLNKHHVRYVLIGGWAVIFEGYGRTTGDMDIFIEPTQENSEKVLLVLKDFFDSTIGFVKEDFSKPDNVLMMGREPNRIDLLTGISGVSFNEVYDNSKVYNDSELAIRCIHINELIRNKEASGRIKDKADAAYLRKIQIKRRNN
jgi:hypothetical protein